MKEQLKLGKDAGQQEKGAGTGRKRRMDGSGSESEEEPHNKAPRLGSNPGSSPSGSGLTATCIPSRSQVG